MGKQYKGVIVKESLSDPNILRTFEVTGHRIVGEPGDTWDLVSVKASFDDIRRLAAFIKEGPWYANFWNKEEEIIAYMNRLFKDADEAREYGLSIGVPPEQLDFKKD